MNDKIALQLAEVLHKELTLNILPFWMAKMPDEKNGGFYGQINGENIIIPLSPKGGILNARILWTFSAAYRYYKNPEYLQMADRAYNYIISHFIDPVSGGTFWCVTHDGQPLETKKQIYSQAFFIYAFSEYFMATGNENCKNEAIKLFNLIEKNSFDKSLNGYFEAYNRNWQLLDDLRLSEKDANEKKTMNTHLHILEAYTNLYRIWKNDVLAAQLRNLITLFLEKIIDTESSHLNLFFNEHWQSKSSITSYGHDIECSWLLYEAALEFGEPELVEKVKRKCLKIVEATKQGLQPDGSIIYEKDNSTGHHDLDRHWWSQAEAVVGFFNAFELTANTDYLKKATNCFSFIENHLLDKVVGEWYWSMLSDGSINRKDDKAGFWKCPYHNGRMCLEIMKRTNWNR